MDSAIELCLTECKTIAVVGLSPKAHRDSYRVSKYMQAQGYRIVPVNPNANEVLGERCYATLSDAAQHEHIDMVNCFRNAEDIPPIAAEAIAMLTTEPGLDGGGGCEGHKGGECGQDDGDDQGRLGPRDGPADDFERVVDAALGEPADARCGCRRARFDGVRRAAFGALERSLWTSFPQVALRDGFYLEYQKGTVVELSFRVTDDYQVKSVQAKLVRAAVGEVFDVVVDLRRSSPTSMITSYTIRSWRSVR